MMGELVEAAKGYWALGVPVVPLKGKQPLVEWAKWQTRPQTLEEFNGLPWSQADGFAIICGSKTKDGLYVGAIDFDVKNLPVEAVERGHQALKGLPVTQIEQTPSGGLHYIFWAREKPKSISAYHNVCGLELIGEGKLCITAPSKGYKRLNDNTPTTVQSLESVFLEAL
ncbi:bifunctional DNA primase/polymerase, partial [Candidatus Bathyarchaeota archaeon]|nr:bifunctional DNA primase/polymerase [Candidatus Bathyarchaeota archaeon]